MKNDIDDFEEEFQIPTGGIQNYLIFAALILLVILVLVGLMISIRG